MGQFYHSVKAFDVLERLDPDPEFWEGKRGAAIGVFQMVVAGKESKERLVEVIQMLKNTNNPQVEYFIQVMKKWGKDNGFKFWYLSALLYKIYTLFNNNLIKLNHFHLKKWSTIVLTIFLRSALGSFGSGFVFLI